MKMERTPQNSGIRWRNPLQSRNWNVDMIPHVSRPTSRISRIGSLHRGHQDVDWISLGGSRMSSRTSSSSSLFDSPPNYGFRGGRPKRRGIIEDLLTKHAAMRPRSISLAKYEPLPSIGQDSPRPKMDPKRASSVGSLIKESHKGPLSDKQTKSDEGPLSVVKSLNASSESMDYNQLEEPDAEEPDAESTAADGPPKLIRSRTFDVIETNLTNLPVIGEPSADDESSEERESAFIDESQFLNLSGPTDASRRSSHSSLFTHPGTPDSGYVAVYPKSQGLFSGGYEHDPSSLADENFYENVASLLPDGSE